MSGDQAKILHATCHELFKGCSIDLLEQATSAAFKLGSFELLQETIGDVLKF